MSDRETERRFTGVLLDMIGQISSRLGISDEDQAAANGAAEILAAIDELKSAAASLAVERAEFRREAESLRAQLSEAQERLAESDAYWRERAELAEASVALWRERAEGGDWRIAASAWLTHKADKQAAMNKAHPRYVECYPEWEQAERALRWYASEVISTSFAAPVAPAAHESPDLWLYHWPETGHRSISKRRLEPGVGAGDEYACYRADEGRNQLAREYADDGLTQNAKPAAQADVQEIFPGTSEALNNISVFPSEGQS